MATYTPHRSARHSGLPGASLLALAFVLAGAAGTAWAQDDPAAGAARLTLTAEFVPASVRPGDTVALLLRIQIVENWHIFPFAVDPNLASPAEIVDELAKGFTPISGWNAPPGFPNEEGLPELTYGVVFKRLYRAPKSAGEYPITGKLRYLACDPNSCDPPADAAFSAKLSVADDAPMLPALDYAAGMDTWTREQQALAQPVVWSARVVPDQKIVPGAALKVAVTATLTAPWHVYPHDAKAADGAVPTLGTLFVPGWSADYGKLVSFTGPKGEVHAEGWPPTLAGAPVFTLVYRLPKAIKPGKYEVAVAVSWMACTNVECRDQEAELTPLSFTVVAGAAPQVPGGAQPPGDNAPPAPGSNAPAPLPGAPGTSAPDSSGAPGSTGGAGAAASATGDAATPKPANEFDRAAKLGFWALMGLAIGAGLISLLTPCVFPMIPITISFFTKQHEALLKRTPALATPAGDLPAASGAGATTREKSTGSARLASLKLALLYGTGIVAAYGLIGFLLGVVLGTAEAGEQMASSPWLNLFLGALLLFFAFNLFGLFEIRIPSGLISKLQKVGGGAQSGSIVATLMMGVIFTLTSFACTGPFVAGVTVAALQGGQWFAPIFAMIAFASALALPFVLLAMFPTLLTKLPKSGGWMVRVKVIMAFIEFAFAFKFLQMADFGWDAEIITRPVFLAIWGVVFVALGFYLLGKLRLPHDSPRETVGPVGLAFGMMVLAIGVWFLTAMNGRPLNPMIDAYLPKHSYGGVGKQWTAEQARVEKLEERLDDLMALVAAGGGPSGPGATADVGPVDPTRAVAQVAPKAFTHREHGFLWIVNDLEAALATARRTGANVFLDITGHQ